MRKCVRLSVSKLRTFGRRTSAFSSYISSFFPISSCFIIFSVYSTSLASPDQPWSYVSFRSLLALILGLIISMWFGEYFING